MVESGIGCAKSHQSVLRLCLLPSTGGQSGDLTGTATFFNWTVVSQIISPRPV